VVHAVDELLRRCLLRASVNKPNLTAGLRSHKVHFGKEDREVPCNGTVLALTIAVGGIVTGIGAIRAALVAWRRSPNAA
jgi:hypothetical protein